MTSGGDETPEERRRRLGRARSERHRTNDRCDVLIVPVPTTRRMVEAIIDRGWLSDADSLDRRKLGTAIANILADLFPTISDFQTKNSVTRHGRSGAIRGVIDSQKSESDRS